jgi:hypothetical protein
MTLIDGIQEEMLNDDEDREIQSELLVDRYNSSDDNTQRSIDQCFIDVCGWSLKTLIEKYHG